ncbi:sulfatase [Tunicatimonas pelagia]|uniref:sulfatase n=1 Tax=Tunicatimonas pelagia TaxID=931531 RepID=UPI0026668766|nr:sulfatase [Tunicatimonas pelagia]WKN44140.1 sulfatase [Tunicatimonas pelagia]
MAIQQSLTLLGFCVLFFTCEPKEEPETKRRPNILFILADDLGYHDLSCTGSHFYETPNIDRIAERGMQFTQGYAACQVCSPSRASIMTGKFPARHGITDWIGAKTGTDWRDFNRHNKLLPAQYVHQLPTEYTTLPEAFQEAGYTTFFSGKWHIGDEGSYPEDHGFDINRGGWEKGSPMGGFFAPHNNPKLADKKAGESLTLRLAEETVDFLEAHKDSSFFAFLSFYAVHAPLETTQEKWKKYRQRAYEQGMADSGFVMERRLPIRTVQDNPVYAGLVSTMDDAVGNVLHALEELGLSDNTIIVFTSDNGGVASGDAYATTNLPLRGGKGYQWEGGIREPYFIAAPWINTAGKKSAVPVSGVDLYPTLLDLAGLELKPNEHTDGVSLLPLMQGDSITERPLYWHYPHYGNQGGDPSSIIRLGDWKLIHYWEDGQRELYNLRDDPQEAANIIEQEPTVAQQLGQQLEQFLRETQANTPEPDLEYNEQLAQARQANIVNELLPRLEQQRTNILQEDWQPNPDWWGSQVDSLTQNSAAVLD